MGLSTARRRGRHSDSLPTEWRLVDIRDLKCGVFIYWYDQCSSTFNTHLAAKFWLNENLEDPSKWLLGRKKPLYPTGNHMEETFALYQTHAHVSYQVLSEWNQDKTLAPCRYSNHIEEILKILQETFVPCQTLVETWRKPLLHADDPMEEILQIL